MPFAIVGVGASAGGLEAYTALLGGLPADTGMAFVFVPHLAPSHASMLPEILQRATQMPVNEVRDEPTVEANHVYVIPPGRTMTIRGGKLRLTQRPEGHHHPVDQFLISLAEYQGHRSIGVILSGTATDGTIGLRAIKAAGGTTFAQDDTAQHDGMPQSAVASGSVDFILPPARIAKEILRIARHPYVAEEYNASSEANANIDEILELMREKSGVDFTQYKSNTLQRRIRRRMMLLKTASTQEYTEHLRAHAAEIEALYRDILIGVTNFFRNPEVFEALKAKVFPKLLAARARKDPVRVWVLGCATGEEPFSLAIALTEYAAAVHISCPIVIYATDLNTASVDKARAAWYPKSIAQEVSPERLRQFFVESDGGYCVAKPIRDLCIFARHNALTDPPFSRMDLISCRNVMIYMEPALQRRLMPILHYALKPDGFLLLGPSETPGANRELFDVEDGKSKLYKKKAIALRLDQAFPLGAYQPFAGERRTENWRELAKELPTTDVQREADRVLMARYMPPGVLVNADLDVLQFRGDTGIYLTPAPGKASLNILKMAREGLLVSLRGLFERVKNGDAPVREAGVRVKSNGGYEEITVSIIPVGRPQTHERCYWVLFEQPVTAPSHARSTMSSARKKAAGSGAGEARLQDEKDRQIGRLTKELGATREYLQSVIEQQEAANEELQSANEEVQSANEELQSINEELETSREEIQSSNEELTTVNEELQNRNEELNRANNDLNNLFSSVQMGIVMVWPDQRIRRFTPIAEKLFNLIPADVGRPIGNIKLNLDVPDLTLLLEETISTVIPRELEVQDKQGHWYLLRIRPYRTLDNQIDGAVIVLVDIDSLKRSQALGAAQTEQLRKRVDELAAADRHKNEFLAMLAHELRNPLAPLRNAVQIMKTANAGEGAINRARDLIARQVDTLSRLVDDLLDAARINRGQVQLRRETIELQDVLSRAVDTTRHLFEERHHRLAVTLPSEPVLLEGDATRLEQVFANILGNAAKYTQQGGEISLTATVKKQVAPASSGETIICVKDNGIGISQEMLPRVFDLFAQADQSLARTQGGLGIGLSLVRSLVELHGGRVSAQSSGLGQGSEFFVQLPLPMTMQPRGKPATDTAAEKSPVPQSANGGESDRDRVLVVDDSADIAESMSMLLSLCGFDVKTALTGHEALDLAASFHPSAILLDIGMPELDGYQVCQLIRQQPGLEETLVIAVTGYGTTEDRARARAAGFDHYLLKPVEPKALQSLLHKAPQSR